MSSSHAVPLTSFSVGSDVLVRIISGQAAHRLRDVGLREGALVCILCNSSNVIVRVAGCRIGLRQEIAQHILGTPASG